VTGSNRVEAPPGWVALPGVSISAGLWVWRLQLLLAEAVFGVVAGGPGGTVAVGEFHGHYVVAG